MTVERPSPEAMSARSRAAEVVDLLALAIVRLHATRPAEREVSLGFSPPERVHTNATQRGV